MKDIVLILVMAFPMILFTVYPALKLGEVVEKMGVDEGKKRAIILFTTAALAILLSVILNKTSFVGGF